MERTTAIEMCSEMVLGSGGWHRHRCTRRGTQEHEGKRYCTPHYPPHVAEKRAERHAAYDAKFAASRRESRLNDLRRKVADAALALPFDAQALVQAVANYRAAEQA